jgi:hypothetical protein
LRYASASHQFVAPHLRAVQSDFGLYFLSFGFAGFAYVLTADGEGSFRDGFIDLQSAAAEHIAPAKR